jgi:hypothetical protein
MFHFTKKLAMDHIVLPNKLMILLVSVHHVKKKILEKQTARQKKKFWKMKTQLR